MANHRRPLRQIGQPAAQPGRAGALGPDQAYIARESRNCRLATGTTRCSPRNCGKLRTSRLKAVNRSAGESRNNMLVACGSCWSSRFQTQVLSLGMSQTLPPQHPRPPADQCCSQRLPVTMGQDPPVDRRHLRLAPAVRAAHRKGRGAVSPGLPEQEGDAEHPNN